jgi:hypothetical protein
MNLKDLRDRTRLYVRDSREKRFSDKELNSYINEGVDRLRAYYKLVDMPYVIEEMQVQYLPEQYHYILALYASSRCFGVDNDFYQEQEKRNEFESMFTELQSKVDNGEVYITDYEHDAEHVIDEYFGITSTDEDNIVW